MKVWVDHMVDHFSTYIYQKRGFYYFSRRVPKDVQPLHGKQRIVLALNTRSRAKALRYSQVICQRLDERWLPMRLDAMGLGNVLVNDVRQGGALDNAQAVLLAHAYRSNRSHVYDKDDGLFDLPFDLPNSAVIN